MRIENSICTSKSITYHEHLIYVSFVLASSIGEHREWIILLSFTLVWNCVFYFVHSNQQNSQMKFPFRHVVSNLLEHTLHSGTNWNPNCDLFHLGFVGFSNQRSLVSFHLLNWRYCKHSKYSMCVWFIQKALLFWNFRLRLFSLSIALSPPQLTLPHLPLSLSLFPWLYVFFSRSLSESLRLSQSLSESLQVLKYHSMCSTVLVQLASVSKEKEEKNPFKKCRLILFLLLFNS